MMPKGTTTARLVGRTNFFNNNQNQSATEVFRTGPDSVPGNDVNSVHQLNSMNTTGEQARGESTDEGVSHMSGLGPDTVGVPAGGGGLSARPVNVNGVPVPNSRRNWIKYREV